MNEVRVVIDLCVAEAFFLRGPHIRQLLSIQELPGLNLPFTNSPLILFKYNEAEDGKISKEDFARCVPRCPLP